MSILFPQRRAIGSLVLLAASTLVLAGCGGGDDDPVSVPLAVIDSGASAIRVQKFVVVRNETEWSAFWSSHKLTVPPPPVDFGQAMVVGVVLGDRPSGCHSVSLKGATVSRQIMTIRYSENLPSPGLGCTAALASPAQLATVQANSVEVRFALD
jgi:hypothetical protein